MTTIKAIFASGHIAYIVLVPVIRELAAVLLAIAISKDCKARDNGSGVLWGIFTLLSPILSGIIYLIYSRFLTKRKGSTAEDKKRIKQSRKLTIWAGIVYTVSLILALVAVITMASSGLADFSIEDTDSIPGYYDMNGKEYETGADVILFDKDANKYHLDKASFGINANSYYDEKGNEYDLEYSYISKDGFFYYDADHSLKASDELYYYDKHFYDSDGNEYAHIDDYAYWDKDGNICIKYIKGNRYAFK